MMMDVKYVRTEDNIIIVFPEYYQHSDFKRFNPISAGFISIREKCTCYGKSISLGLSSLPDDSALADKQILQLI